MEYNGVLYKYSGAMVFKDKSKRTWKKDMYLVCKAP